MLRLRYLLRSLFVVPGHGLLRIGKMIYATPAELHEINIQRWLRVKGDQTLRLEYPLNESSVVFDVGGYHGDWAEDIFNRYHCTIHIFEPLPEYIQTLEKRFAGNPKIHIHPVGLGGKSRSEEMGLLDNASSAFKTAGPTAQVQFQDVSEVFTPESLPKIDLLKMNIEGGEFELLDRLLETKLVERVTDIQIQFHNFVPNAEARRQAIRTGLSQTHVLTYDFPFVWENWKHR